jgi:ubiquinone/menaquinone biosynthesis C-methylase UbiE
MTKIGNVAQFTSIDSSTDAGFFVDFMDRANALPEYPGIRRDLATALGELRGRRVLEVGCGTGEDASELARLVGPDGRVVGVDMSEAMITEARRRTAGSDLRVEFALGDARRLDFPDATFDGIYTKLVLMHCADIEAALDELLRVTRPGGRIAAYDIDFDTVIVDHPDRDTTRAAMRCVSDGVSNGWSGRQLKRRFLSRGMTGVTIAAHTVVTPFHIFYSMAAGPLQGAQADGRLDLSPAQLDAWWQPLLRAEQEGRFFSSFTGFVVAAARSAAA